MTILEEKSNEIIITVEEYIFGHKGGMGPIAFSSTLSKGDINFLYNIIEMFQGSINWEADKWSISWYYLPSKKVAVTVVFPDSDITGRSTVLGHTIIISLNDFKKIQFNPFVLVDLKLFSRKKEYESHIESRNIKITVDQINMGQKIVGNVPKDFDKILKVGFSGKKIIIGTRTPANKLLQNIVYCLPHSVRSSFTFSSMEIKIPLSIDKNKTRRNILFSAVPIKNVKEMYDNREFDVYMYEGEFLSTTQNQDKKGEPLSPSLYSENVLNLIKSDINLSELFNKIDERFGSNLNQDQYAIALKVFSEIDKNVFSSKELEEVKSLFYGVEHGSDLFIKLCLKSVENSPDAEEWVAIHKLIEETVKNHPKKDYWYDMAFVYKKMIAQHELFCEFLIQRYKDHMIEVYYKKFSNEIIPIIVEYINSRLETFRRSPNEIISIITSNRETNLKELNTSYKLIERIVKQLNELSWINRNDVNFLIIQITELYIQGKLDDIDLTIVEKSVRKFNIDEFNEILNIIFKNKADINRQERILDAIIGDDNQYKDLIYSSEQFEKLHLLIEKYHRFLSDQTVRSKVKLLVESALRAFGDQYWKRILTLFTGFEFHNYRNELISGIMTHCNARDQIKYAMDITNEWGIKEGFKIVKNLNELTDNNRQIFFDYLKSVKNMIEKDQISADFYTWLKQIIRRRYAKDYSFRQKRLIKFFGIELKEVEIYPAASLKTQQQIDKRSWQKEKLINTVLIIEFAMIIIIVCSIIEMAILHKEPAVYRAITYVYEKLITSEEETYPPSQTNNNNTSVSNDKNSTSDETDNNRRKSTGQKSIFSQIKSNIYNFIKWFFHGY